ALGVYFYYLKFDADVAASVGWLPLVSLVLYVIAFSLGYGPIPWLMMGELFSPDVKELAASIALLANWIFAFITTLIYQPLTVIRFEITLFENTQIESTLLFLYLLEIQ
ncbi:Solute carrier family 2, facilitated glucose transporter member 12, partial [Armadillidium vulgare]